MHTVGGGVAVGHDANNVVLAHEDVWLALQAGVGSMQECVLKKSGRTARLLTQSVASRQRSQGPARPCPPSSRIDRSRGDASAYMQVP